MTKKPTDKQKSLIWMRERGRNFRASCLLEGIVLPEGCPDENTVQSALDRLRRHYER
ncbi:YhfG family protein [Erwinia sp. HR93]|uniref:YhfG family protein n=1 Tax=Erwinia sp. HR93 TaxID=3094840 RepID=UPI002ADEDFBF|nr:YhfG family protein [Erwinia sp. HR93]MEA1063122.1 DUF2559 family protein [Erwinia sp. HR93]